MVVVLEDVAAWTAARDGDRRAFAELYDRHYDRVFRHVVGVTEQPADADEVTAGAFFELWRRRGDVRVVNDSVLPWLLVTAGNLARNHGRKLGRYRGLLRRLPRDPEWVDAAAIVDETTEAETRAAAVAHALARLKSVDAQLIALTLIAEFPITDAAAAVGLSPGAARVRLHRARGRLRDDLRLLLHSHENGSTS